MQILVPVSGGKDSQACLQLAIEHVGQAQVRGLFCDTQFEHPLTYQHIKDMQKWYGVRIDTVTAGDVPSKVRKYGRFPGGGARFCTEELKIVPTKKYAKVLAEELGHGFEVWYGMRTEESVDRKIRYRDRVGNELLPLHEMMPGKYPKYLATLGVMARLPILDWSKWQVLQEVGERLNPLYRHNFDRVGCFPCLAAGDVHKERAFGFDEFGREQKVIVLQLEKETGKSIWTSIGGAMRNNPDQMCLLCHI
ncbi:phosphoadenosine phosphosulfate reductase family protein [Bordetella bronchiseptica]|uniref:phosphoadenosine phosphosulfate reductase family protein n=1 Tax=Bordetella bronchiseptica TaxID=518 RepID=UPI000461C21F|nr:phosphoadenosine phosphosulfate reductase family protein [Bordetella bronchiseptica]KDC48034.1 phosphoadenosine phosphosulfate reductase family protein [Bordetella bronchiseptica M85/00/2]